MSVLESIDSLFLERRGHKNRSELRLSLFERGHKDIPYHDRRSRLSFLFNVPPRFRICPMDAYFPKLDVDYMRWGICIPIMSRARSRTFRTS